MEAPPNTDLLGSVRRGLGWTLGSQAAGQAVRLGTVLVLARLLTPGDYGLAGMAFVFSGLALLVFDLALGAALVQRRDVVEADYSTVFWTNAVLGVLCTLAGIGLSGPIASFYGEPEVRPLFLVLSLGFMIAALGSTQIAVLTRSLDFRSLEISFIGGALAGAAVAVGIAAWGKGPWALVAQQLATAVASVALLWVFSSWRPRFVFSRTSLRELGGFGASMFGTRLLFYVHRNVDNLLIGRFLGASPLGAYALAYNLVLLPFNRIVDPIRHVLFPTLSRIQDDRERIAAAWLRVVRLVAAIFLPGMLGLAVVAPELVPVVLGERWSGVIRLLQILSFVGLLQSLAAVNSIVLPVLGRTTTLLRFSVVAFLASLAGFAVGLHWGVKGVAAGYLAANVVVVPLYTLLTARALGVSFLALPRAVAGVAEAALGMLACALGVRFLLSGADLQDWARLGILVLTGVGSFVPLCAWRAPEVVRDLGRLRKGGGVGPALADA